MNKATFVKATFKNRSACLKVNKESVLNDVKVSDLVIERLMVLLRLRVHVVTLLQCDGFTMWTAQRADVRLRMCAGRTRTRQRLG